MTSASEVFVLQLSRASARANKFLRARSLNSDDRNDVVATAILWCWENRDNYSLTVTLDLWFLGAVRDAYKAWRAGEARNSSETIAEIPTGDTTQAAAEALSSAQALIRALPREYKRVLLLESIGYTREEMEGKGLSRRTIDEGRARIKQLRKLMPDAHEYRRVLRAYHPPSDSAVHPSHDGVSNTHQPNIDKEIAALDFPPPAGKECPPCWRCKWFEGYMPGSHVSVRMPITEPKIAEAVYNTEAEKVRIAQEVRNGTI
jgi:DNA-directed RNA polymerase specialized sigma24 family protein